MYITFFFNVKGEKVSKENNWAAVGKAAVKKLDPNQIVGLANSVISSAHELKRLKTEYEYKAKELEINNNTKLHELKLEYDHKQNELKEKGNIFIQALKHHEETYRFHIQKQFEIAIENIQAVKLFLQIPDISSDDRRFALEIMLKENSKVLDTLSEQSLKALDQLPNQPLLKD